jgi:hypothetical protein
MNLHGNMVCPQGTTAECPETTTTTTTTIHLEPIADPVLDVLPEIPIPQDKPAAGFSIVQEGKMCI